jgi:hypothetical protein
MIFEAFVSAVVCINSFRRNLTEFRSDVDEVVSLLIRCLSHWAYNLQLLFEAYYLSSNIRGDPLETLSGNVDQ